jgi:hypothetical protein
VSGRFFLDEKIKKSSKIMLHVKALKPPIKTLSYRRRIFGSTVENRQEARSIEKSLESVSLIIENLLVSDSQDIEEEINDLEDLEMYLMLKRFNLTRVADNFYQPLPRIQNKNLKIDDITDANIADTFRFRSKLQLRRFI